MNRTPQMALLLAGAALATSAPDARAGDPPQAINTQLTAAGFDWVRDDARDRLYVSMPEAGKIAVVSTIDFSLIQDAEVGLNPYGLDMSLDGSRLYIALRETGSVAVMELDSLCVVDIIDVQAELGTALTYDLAVGQADRLYVSGNPGSGGLAWIVQVELDNGNAVTRVASNRIIRANPVFEKSPDLQSLYVGEGFSPNSLYKLDLTQTTAPIVLEDDHGSIFGTNHLELSPDGSRIYLSGGQVLRTDTFLQDGTVGSGPHDFEDGGDGSLVWGVDLPNTVQSYDTTTYFPGPGILIPCALGTFEPSPSRLEVLPSGRGQVVLAQDLLCGQAIFGALPPVITGLTPDRAPYDATDFSFLITGSGFLEAPVLEVTVGGTPVGAFLVFFDDRMAVVLPPGEPGPADVRVVTEAGEFTLVEGFAYTPALYGDQALALGETFEVTILHSAGDSVFLLYGALAAEPLAISTLGGELSLASPKTFIHVSDWPLESLTVAGQVPFFPSLVGFSTTLQALAGTDLRHGVGAFSNTRSVTIQ